MDILSLVPGFSFGNDVDAVVGADFRGLWAYEGKILLLIDGIPVNEGLYGTVQMGRHYSAALIKQVEIIRGPGSARYGGNAELAVLSVTTKAADQHGGFASVRPEVASGRVGTSVDAGAGYTFANGWRAAFGAHYGDFIRSDRTYVSLGGHVIDMKDDDLAQGHHRTSASMVAADQRRPGRLPDQVRQAHDRPASRHGVRRSQSSARRGGALRRAIKSWRISV
jgi:outer membrane receptor protein involved in Fe transport